MFAARIGDSLWLDTVSLAGDCLSGSSGAAPKEPATQCTDFARALAQRPKDKRPADTHALTQTAASHSQLVARSLWLAASL